MAPFFSVLSSCCEERPNERRSFTADWFCNLIGRRSSLSELGPLEPATQDLVPPLSPGYGALPAARKRSHQLRVRAAASSASKPPPAVSTAPRRDVAHEVRRGDLIGTTSLLSPNARNLSGISPSVSSAVALSPASAMPITHRAAFIEQDTFLDETGCENEQDLCLEECGKIIDPICCSLAGPQTLPKAELRRPRHVLFYKGSSMAVLSPRSVEHFFRAEARSLQLDCSGIEEPERPPAIPASCDMTPSPDVPSSATESPAIAPNLRPRADNRILRNGPRLSRAGRCTPGTAAAPCSENTGTLGSAQHETAVITSCASKRKPRLRAMGKRSENQENLTASQFNQKDANNEGCQTSARRKQKSAHSMKSFPLHADPRYAR